LSPPILGTTTFHFVADQDGLSAPERVQPFGPRGADSRWLPGMTKNFSLGSLIHSSFRALAHPGKNLLRSFFKLRLIAVGYPSGQKIFAMIGARPLSTPAQ
jgi:hypothetical protein